MLVVIGRWSELVVKPRFLPSPSFVNQQQIEKLSIQSVPCCHMHPLVLLAQTAMARAKRWLTEKGDCNIYEKYCIITPWFSWKKLVCMCIQRVISRGETIHPGFDCPYWIHDFDLIQFSGCSEQNLNEKKWRLKRNDDCSFWIINSTNVHFCV